MSLVRVGARAELPRNSVAEFRHGERTVAICDVEGVLCAVQGECPHQNGPLGQGNVIDGVLVCPWHAWEFHCDGDELDKYPVEERGGEIFVELPDHAGTA